MSASSILLVEPHADDAFLCLGQHLDEWRRAGRRTKILTVFSGTRKRANDAQAFARAVGAEWEGWGFVEGEPLPEDLLFRLPGCEFPRILLPIALTHPEHIAVRELLDHPGCQFYLDQPYATTQKNGPLVTEKLAGMRVVSFRRPGVRKYRHIPLFKDQAKFFHFNPAEKLVATCELIVER